MGFLDSAGSFLTNWGKPLATAALVGYGLYENNRAQKARDRQQKAYQSALEQQYENEQAAFEAPAPAPLVIPALSGEAAAKASKLYKEYYNQALQLYAPYREAGTRMLPQQEGLFNSAASGLSQLSKAMFTPEGIAETNQSTPFYNIPLQLPKTLRGSR